MWKRLKSENWHAWYKDKIIFILFFRMKICNMPEPVWIFKVLSERRLYFCLNFSFLFQLLRMLHLSGSIESWGSRLEVLDEMWATLLNKFFFFLIHSERDTSGMNVVLQHAAVSPGPFSGPNTRLDSLAVLQVGQFCGYPTILGFMPQGTRRMSAICEHYTSYNNLLKTVFSPF